MTTLHMLCAGAAQGLVMALAPRLQVATGATLQARFGAVGAMKQALLEGAPCDLMVLTDPMVDLMVADALLRGDSRTPLGTVRTAIAVRRGGVHPDVSTPEALAAALRAADAVYSPDPVRSTAGIHFTSVLRRLSIADELAARLHAFPNGATAMRELAASTAAQPIGCTQVTEILCTPGVELVAVLPVRFELATVYTAAVHSGATAPELAARFIALLRGAESADLRRCCGFED